MKTLMIFLSILCVSALSINAQGPFDQGKWILAGTMPFGGSSEDLEHLGGVNGAGIFFGSNWTSLETYLLVCLNKTPFSFGF